jgi:hypothetical protein
MFSEKNKTETRDRAKDKRLFNCTEFAELNSIVELYAARRQPSVRKFLMNAIADGTIYQDTYMEIYRLIDKKLGYAVPE